MWLMVSLIVVLFFIICLVVLLNKIEDIHIELERNIEFIYTLNDKIDHLTRLKHISVKVNDKEVESPLREVLVDLTVENEELEEENELLRTYLDSYTSV